MIQQQKQLADQTRRYQSSPTTPVPDVGTIGAPTGLPRQEPGQYHPHFPPPAPSHLPLPVLPDNSRDTVSSLDSPMELTQEAIANREIISMNPQEHQWIFIHNPSQWSTFLPPSWSPSGPLLPAMDYLL